MNKRFLTTLFVINLCFLPAIFGDLLKAGVDKKVGVGVLIGGGRGALGIDATLLKRLAVKGPILVGVDMGLYTYFNPSGIVIPVLPTMLYRFPDKAKWSPFLGVSLGAVLTLSTLNSFDVGFFAKGGIEYKASNGLRYNAEARLGTIGGSLIFWPVFALAF